MYINRGLPHSVRPNAGCTVILFVQLLSKKYDSLYKAKLNVYICKTTKLFAAYALRIGKIELRMFKTFLEFIHAIFKIKVTMSRCWLKINNYTYLIFLERHL